MLINACLLLTAVCAFDIAVSAILRASTASSYACCSFLVLSLIYMSLVFPPLSSTVSPSHSVPLLVFAVFRAFNLSDSTSLALVKLFDAVLKAVSRGTFSAVYFL